MKQPEQKKKHWLLRAIAWVKNLDNEFNKTFRDEVFMPMIKFAVTLMFLAVVLDYAFQLIEAIDILTL